MNSIRISAQRAARRRLGPKYRLSFLLVSAAVIVLWEYALALHDECKYIWRGSMNRVKALYMFSRYSTLAIHASNTYIVFGPLSHTPVRRFACMSWFLLLTVGACFLLASVDALVMLRVYMLYNRSKAIIACVLTALMFLQFGLVALCIGRTLHVVPFSDTCDLLQTPHDVVYILGAVILTQAVLLILTLAKRKVASGASPVVHLVVHDGARVFLLIVSLWSTIIPYSLFMQVSKPHIIFVQIVTNANRWPIALMSIATCRLIMHMQKLRLEVISSTNLSETGDNDIVLTSIIASVEDLNAAAVDSPVTPTGGSSFPSSPDVMAMDTPL